jgi:hypothetical protein
MYGDWIVHVRASRDKNHRNWDDFEVMIADYEGMITIAVSAK